MKKSIRAAVLPLTAVSIALASPAVSTAEPKEWDIGSYDSCVAKVEDNFNRGNIAAENLADGYRECCLRSGGVWSGQGDQGHCVAPPAQANVSTIPSHVLTPSQPVIPPGEISLTPAP